MHADHASSPNWVAQVEQSCARQGLQITPLRRNVLAILSESAAPLGAYAIIEALAKREGKSIAPPTVYRTLDFFLEHGFLHKVESRNVYAPCEHLGHAHQSVLLICEQCGRSVEVQDASLADALKSAAERSGFVTRRRMIELVGLCQECGQAVDQAS